MSGTVLDHLYRIVDGRNGSQITSKVEDKKTGRKIGFRASIRLDHGSEEKMVLTGFSYLPDRPETIGVMDKIAQIGAAEDRQIIVYFDDRSFRDALVFHAQAFVDHGIDEAKQDERKQRGERWLNLDRDWAVNLQEYADGTATPKEKPSKEERVERDGGWFNV